MPVLEVATPLAPTGETVQLRSGVGDQFRPALRLTKSARPGAKIVRVQQKDAVPKGEQRRPSNFYFVTAGASVQTCSMISHFPSGWRLKTMI